MCSWSRRPTSRIVKSANAASVVAGGTVTYTLLVTNDGPSTAPEVVVDDPLPAGVTVLDTSASQGTCAVAVGGVTCRFGALAAGGSAQATITATVAVDAAGATLVNEASVVGGIFDPRLQNNRSSASITVTELPTLLPQPVPDPLIGPALTITKIVDRDDGHHRRPTDLQGDRRESRVGSRDVPWS